MGQGALLCMTFLAICYLASLPVLSRLSQPAQKAFGVALLLRSVVAVLQGYSIGPFQAEDSAYYVALGLRWKQVGYYAIELSGQNARKNIGMISIARGIAEVFPASEVFLVANLLGALVSLFGVLLAMSAYTRSGGVGVRILRPWVVLLLLLCPTQLSFVVGNFKEAYILGALGLLFWSLAADQRRYPLAVCALWCGWAVRPMMILPLAVAALGLVVIRAVIRYRSASVRRLAAFIAVAATTLLLTSARALSSEQFLRADVAATRLSSPFRFGVVPIPFLSRAVWGPEPWFLPLSFLGLVATLEVLFFVVVSLRLGVLFLKGRVHFERDKPSVILFSTFVPFFCVVLPAAFATNAGLLLRLRTPGFSFAVLFASYCTYSVRKPVEVGQLSIEEHSAER